MPATPTQALWTLRAIWSLAALTQGTLALYTVTQDTRMLVNPSGAQTFTLCVGALLLIAGGGLVRSQCYKRYWRSDVIAPTGYVQGNVAMMIALTIASAAVMPTIVEAGDFRPMGLGVLAIVWIMGTANFPHGKPMQPHSPHWR